MSKFKVIDGSNVTSIVEKNREIIQFEAEIKRKGANLTDKDCVVYAYHFVRLGHLLLAQKYLNKLSVDYFDNQVYRDLSHALLVWSIVKADETKNYDYARPISEYFIVLKRAIETFNDVNFVSKPAFNRFKKQFIEFTTIPQVK